MCLKSCNLPSSMRFLSSWDVFTRMESICLIVDSLQFPGTWKSSLVTKDVLIEIQNFLVVTKKKTCSIFECTTSQNGHFENLAAFTARFIKCVWPFWDVMHQKIKLVEITRTLPNFSLSGILILPRKRETNPISESYEIGRCFRDFFQNKGFYLYYSAKYSTLSYRF